MCGVEEGSAEPAPHPSPVVPCLNIPQPHPTGCWNQGTQVSGCGVARVVVLQVQYNGRPRDCEEVTLYTRISAIHVFAHNVAGGHVPCRQAGRQAGRRASESWVSLQRAFQPWMVDVNQDRLDFSLGLTTHHSRYHICLPSLDPP